MPTKSAKTESDGFSAEERAAMKERAAELRAEGKKGAKKADGLQAVLDSIAKMAPEDRALAERVHVAVTTNAPELTPKTWCAAVPTYANEAGKVVAFFFQDAGEFSYRYATLGFQDAANLDDGDLWPTALRTPEVEPRSREASRRPGEGRDLLDRAPLPVVEEVAQQPHSLPRNCGQGGEWGLDRLDRRGVTALRWWRGFRGSAADDLTPQAPVVEEVARATVSKPPEEAAGRADGPARGGDRGGTVSRGRGGGLDSHRGCRRGLSDTGSRALRGPGIYAIYAAFEGRVGPAAVWSWASRSITGLITTLPVAHQSRT